MLAPYFWLVNKISVIISLIKKKIYFFAAIPAQWIVSNHITTTTVININN